MPASSDRRSVRWLRGELPSLVSSGTISEENARAIEQYYARQESGSRGFGFVLLATIGAALVAAGIVLLIAHNWDDFSRPVRSVIAFLPLISAQALSAFRPFAAGRIQSVARMRRHLQRRRHRDGHSTR